MASDPSLVLQTQAGASASTFRAVPSDKRDLLAFLYFKRYLVQYQMSTVVLRQFLYIDHIHYRFPPVSCKQFNSFAERID